MIHFFQQQYAYAVDINQQATSSNFQCLRSNSYSTVFVRAYKPDGSGSVDYNGVPNINMAYNGESDCDYLHHIMIFYKNHTIIWCVFIRGALKKFEWNLFQPVSVSRCT